MSRHRWLLALAAALVLGGALTLRLPWWRAARGAFDMATGVVAPAPELAGRALVGGGASAVLWTLAVLAAGGAVLPLSERGRTAVVVVAAAGGGTAAIAGLAAVTAWGGGRAGPWLAITAGVLAVAAAVASVSGGDGTRRPALVACAFVGLLVAAVAPGAPSPHVRPATGPFEAVAALTTADVVAGDAALPWIPGDPAVLDGAPVMVGRTNVVGLDADGRALPLVTSGDDRFSTVVGGRGIAATGGSGIVVRDLRGGASTTVTGVSGNVGPIGPRDTVFVSALADAGVHELDPARLPPGTVDVAALPVAGAPRVDAVPVDGAGVWRELARDRRGGRVVLASAAGERVLAGGGDAACGWTADPARSYLAATSDNRDVTDVITVDRAGGTWFTDLRRDGTHLLRLGPDGTLRVVEHPLPTSARSLFATPDGGLLVVVDAPQPALWRLPDAAAATSALPAPGPGCGTQRRPAGPALAVDPVDPATLPPGGAVVDGHGGTWSVVDGVDDVPVLVHRGSAGEQRSPLPAVANLSFPVGPDLGAGPLLVVDHGTSLFVDGRLVPVAPTRADGGAIGPDGRGWLLLDGRLVAVDGGTAGAAVIDAGPRVDDPTPAAVQLAQGVAPTALSVRDAHVGLDRAGRGIVVTADGVVLRATGTAVEVLGEVPDHEVPGGAPAARYIDPDVGFLVPTTHGPARLPLP